MVNPSIIASRGVPAPPDIIKFSRDTLDPKPPVSSSVTSVPAPAGITAPVNEKPRTVFAPLDTVKPAAAASPHLQIL